MNMYDVIKALILPPASFIVLMAVGIAALAFNWRRTGLLITAFSVTALYLASTPYGAGRLASLVQLASPLDEGAVAENPPGAIVILSAGLLPYAPEYGLESERAVTVDAATLQRLAYGAYLWRRFNLPVLVSGGDAPDAPRPLAVYMKETLEQNFGVPVMWMEGKSRNTLENADFSAAILRDAGIKRVLLVTHAVHMPRAVRFFTLAGLDALPAPTTFIPPARRFPYAFRPKMSALEDSTFAIYEVLGTAWYRAVKDDFAPEAAP
jgi:uncharacterized SAM-binding protein YcdF (DUF218 family)